MRKLKHHEQKLLRKVNFLTWKGEDNLRENKILRRYHITKREDYVRCATGSRASLPWDRVGRRGVCRTAPPEPLCSLARARARARPYSPIPRRRPPRASATTSSRA